MRVICKKISLDSLSSRLPGVIPSIVDSWSVPSLYTECNNGINREETYYNYSVAIKRASEYNINPSQLEYKADFIEFNKNNLLEFSTGNYGLIPSDIIIPEEIAEKITDYTDIYVNLPDNNGGFYDLSWPKKLEDPHYDGRKIISGGTEIKILTYSTLNKWYAFFKEYYGLINNPSNVSIYDNAVDYYNKEFFIKNADRYKYFKNLDDLFESRGGNEMYEWISNNCILEYQIPAKFTDAWKTTFLYYNDAIKWYKWFNDRIEDFKNVLYIEDCSIIDMDNSTCCDCVEFVKLGGVEFYSDLKKWVDEVELKTDFATKAASITIPISITNSIDDLGEMTIFSNKWIEEVDYHNTLNNSKYGTVIDRPYLKYYKCKYCGYEAPENEFKLANNKCPKCYSNEFNVFDKTLNETYIINPGENKKGYEYNQYYENVFKISDWTNYTDYYINNNKELFESTKIESFTYSPLNGKVIYNPVEITDSINVHNKANVCINGNTYDVIDGKYVEICYSTNIFADLKYKKNIKLQIFKDGDIEYTIFNGKRKYVEVNPNDPSKEKVYFLKESNCHDEGCAVSSGQYIVLDGSLYLVVNGSVTIEDYDASRVYPLLDGYFILSGNTFYVSGNTVVVQDSCDYNEDYNIYTYKFREINEEDLKLFGLNKILINDDGTIATLYYIFSANNCRIISGKTNSKLNILRRKEVSTDDLGNELPGYFRSIVDINKKTKQSRYNLPYDECTLDILYKVGEVSSLQVDAVDKTKFFGNIITNIKFYYKDKNGNVKIEHDANDDNAIEIIEQCIYEFLHSDDDILDTLLCDITYHIGAVINKKGDKYSIDYSAHSGVKYIDTVYVTKQVGSYYLNNDTQFTFKYYLLSHYVNTIKVTDFNEDIIEDGSTYFEMEPMIYIINNDKIAIYDEEKFKDFDKNNSMIVAPLFRTEFNLASSYPQNVEADIYIDRGINAAFEKHLKLQEIRSVEAMENYGNGWFRISN